jgi:DNA-binding response OmpR family regulator/two-component sensor histidine kinase
MERLEKEKVMEMDRMKSRFFANISHEFRTPLTLILGPVEDLLKQDRDEARVKKELLKLMRRNGRRLLRLINQLLDLSRLETGRVKLQVSEGNLEEFVRTIVHSFLSLAERRKIHYKHVLPETDLPVLFDRDKMEKILTNLISNAFKFTSEQGEVHVSMAYDMEDGTSRASVAEIKVSDTGKGIPLELQDKIFDRFYQISDADNRDAEGTGIGLALTRELVDLYRGEISVESEPGKGSMFTVRLPVSRESFPEGEIVEEPGEEIPSEDHSDQALEGTAPIEKGPVAARITGDHGPRPLVLIVEDNADLRKYISVNLGHDYEILHADNGRMGLERATDQIPDLVISDVMMPEMDGMEMCERIKQDERTCHIPVVMLTAKADRESRMEGLETGADDYLVKPFDAEELQVRVKNLIEQRSILREKYRKEFAPESGEEGAFVFQDTLLQKVLDICEKHMDDPDFTIEDLSSELHMSRAQVYRKVNAVSGSTPNELLRMIRLKKAARMLKKGTENVTQVMYHVGYRNLSFFAKSFKQSFGVNPSEYRTSRH